MPTYTKELQIEKIEKTVLEMADAHCHLDLMDKTIIDNAIKHGVKTLITNGVDTKSNLRNFELSDHVRIFPMFGVDPEHGIGMSDKEIEENIALTRANAGRIVGIGEIGLDNCGKVGEYERQKVIFNKFLDLAVELRLPISVHSRGALDDVLSILEQKRVERAHIHFFEGNVIHAKKVERQGYMVSIPPLDSEKRRKVIKEVFDR